MSTLITDSDDIIHFTAVFGQIDLAVDIAPKLGCTEVDALAGLLRALGEPALADTWVDAHAVDDELGDRHYQGDPTPYLVPVDPMDVLQCDSCQ
ncbi:hypothetical protein ACFVU2_01850 [Leifsonia sp. NPDC058194]|uniref:hypothetical protein n=1 Tax=Leifsonia sp. NPDC058194 TaxID=3346374 RepID=UPI0036DA1DD6